MLTDLVHSYYMNINDNKEKNIILNRLIKHNLQSIRSQIPVSDWIILSCSVSIFSSWKATVDGVGLAGVVVEIMISS